VPATINGIGTHYYGGANRSARVDVCKSCGRSATLSSYDTREWFCVLFIPIIPLQKYRILNDCSSCRRHHRVPAGEFTQKLTEVTAPFRESIRRAPREPEGYIKLVQALIGWEMRADAQRELDAAVALFPQNVDIALLAAQLAVGRRDLNAALSLYERAYKIDPQNPTVTYGYGWVLHQLEKYEQAIPILQHAAAQEGNKLGALYLLGVSQMKLSRWNDALNALQQLLTLEPAYTRDKKTMRLVRECKQRLGYQLNEAERRAGRRWWPFERKPKPQTLQRQPTLVRPSLRIAGLAILAISLVSVSVYEWDRWTNIEVYLDNGLDRTVKIDLDGQHFDIGRNSMRKEEMKSGPHQLVARGAEGKEIERLNFHIDKMSVIDAIFHDRFFVYDVAAHNVYRRATHGYAARSEDSSYGEELIGMQRFLEQRDVDYPFQAPPETISIDSNKSSVKKISFNTAKEIDLAKYALIRLQQGKTEEAKSAIDRAAANAPCDTATRRTQVYLVGMMGSLDKASDTAHQWIADCAQDDLEAHRAYQDVNNENGRQQTLREEYLKLLSASPDSGKAHYLYGRVASDPSAAIAQYQEAIRLDPKLIWPRVALGHAYQSIARYEDALREFRVAVDMEGRDPSVVVYFATAAIAKGDPAEATAKVDEIRKANVRDSGALEARWLLALASSDWKTADEIQKSFAKRERPENAWWRSLKLLRLKGDPYLDTTIDTAMRSKELHYLAIQAKIMQFIDRGDFAQASDVIEKNAKDVGPATSAIFEAYTAAGFILQGHKPEADKLLAEAEKTLADQPKSSSARVTTAIVQGLRGTISMDALMTVGRENDAMAHAWFVAAVRDPAHRAEYFTRCIQAASDLDFPYLEAKAMARL